jgi:hypothetical protein
VQWSIDNNLPVCINSMSGMSSFEDEFNWNDLFGMQDLSFLIRPYGFTEVKGFFIQAVHPDNLSLLSKQIDSIGVGKFVDIEWLFSWDSYRKKKFYPVNPQKGLPYDDELSNMADEQHVWISESQIDDNQEDEDKFLRLDL